MLNDVGAARDQDRVLEEIVGGAVLLEDDDHMLDDCDRGEAKLLRTVGGRNIGGVLRGDGEGVVASRRVDGSRDGECGRTGAADGHGIGAEGTSRGVGTGHRGARKSDGARVAAGGGQSDGVGRCVSGGDGSGSEARGGERVTGFEGRR